ncbi:hypothetical protein [Streptomyces sp. NPDC014734]|uniref:hypothetical protein n=1 Tax=Streptomyces sp. NPDC014734 TaxID=3364886 RepID=UPI0036FB1115
MKLPYATTCKALLTATLAVVAVHAGVAAQAADGRHDRAATAAGQAPGQHLRESHDRQDSNIWGP